MKDWEIAEWRRQHVPLFNDNRLKLGIFGPNVSNMCAITLAETTFRPTWEQNKFIAQRLDRAGFEFLLPVARWRGFGGESNFNGNCLETYTWAAASAAVTERIMLVSTSHVGTVHPIVAAKQGVTIDQVSGGRFALNIVCGWFSPEMEMFSGSQLPRAERYRHAAEWTEILLKLWQEDEEFDFDGQYFHIKKGWAQPKPVQQPRPVLINAGASEEGRDFSAKYADFNFVVFNTLDDAKFLIADVKRRAHEYHRDIGMCCNAYVVCRETEQEAKDYFHYYVHEKGDWAAADNLVRIFGMESASMPPAVLDEFKTRFMAGWGGYPLVGTPEQVAAGLKQLSDTGFDGCVLSWVDFNQEFEFFADRVMPLLEQQGIRRPLPQPLAG